MPILLKIFCLGLELVNDEKRGQSFSTRGKVSLDFEFIAYVVVDSRVRFSPQSKSPAVRVNIKFLFIATIEIISSTLRVAKRVQRVQ